MPRRKSYKQLTMCASYVEKRCRTTARSFLVITSSTQAVCDHGSNVSTLVQPAAWTSSEWLVREEDNNSNGSIIHISSSSSSSNNNNNKGLDHLDLTKDSLMVSRIACSTALYTLYCGQCNLHVHSGRLVLCNLFVCLRMLLSSGVPHILFPPQMMPGWPPFPHPHAPPPPAAAPAPQQQGTISHSSRLSIITCTLLLHLVVSSTSSSSWTHSSCCCYWWPAPSATGCCWR